MKIKFKRRTPPQKRISESKTRFNVACWGRQSGKTTFGIEKMLWKPLVGPENAVYWYVLQTHSSAEIAFNRYIQQPGVWHFFERKPNHSNKIVFLKGNRQIFFQSGQNYQDLRTETLHGSIIDEMRQQHKDLWPMIIRPMLARYNGWCDFLSTSNGFDHFYDLYQFALENRSDWSTFHAPSSESWWWTEQELASAKATMSEDQYAQEIMAEFRDIYTGKAYMSAGFHNWREDNPFAPQGMEVSPYLPIILGADFNVNPMAWVLGQSKTQMFYWFDEIYRKNTDTPECASIFADKVQYYQSQGLKANPAVMIIGDASGKSRRTSAAGETDYSIIINELRKRGITYEHRTPDTNPSVKDRVNNVNAVLRAADGSTRCWVHPVKCKQLKRDLERVSWKEGTSNAQLEKKKDPDLTHASDAIGYAISVISPIRHTEVGTMRVISRAF